MRIHLIRHGPSAHVARPAFLDRAGVARWLAEYDAAGIATAKPPPSALVDHVAHADSVIASDLPRAAASAAKLWPGRSVVLSPLFREIPLRIPSLNGLRMPLSLWELAIHAHWGLDILSRREMTAEVREQLDDAAAWCQQAYLERGPASVLAVVTHGVFRHMLAHQLRRNGWKMLSWRRSYAPWSLWTVERPDAHSA